MRREFVSADADEDGIVKGMRGVSPLLRRKFALIDADGSGTLTRAEIVDFTNELLPLQAAASASRVVLTVSAEGLGLFDLLDVNRDQRLGLRELRSAQKIGLQANGDGDGSIVRDKIPRSFQLTVRLGTLEHPDQTASASGHGPSWFDRMDRNRDGDISRREFLGNDTAFRKLDRDADGLIGIDEALSVAAGSE